MRKIVSLILALSFVCLAAVACGKKYDRYNYDLDEYITLAEYKNLPAKANDTRVTDDAIKLQAESAVQYYSKNVEVTDRTSVPGDTVNIDYVGYVDNYENDYVTIRDVDVIVGVGVYPAEFEHALVGLSAGNMNVVDVTFPETFEEYPDYAGKTAHITVYVNSVSETVYPEYTDDFVRAYLHHDSIEDYENAIREALEAKHEEGFYMNVIGQIWDTVVDGTEVKKYPDAEVKYYYDKLVDSVSSYVELYNLNMEAFISSNFEMTEEEFYDYAMDYAQTTVKEQMVVNAIARRENITISESEYKELGEEYAKDVAGLESLAELEENYSRSEIEEVLLGDKVKKAVADLALITWVTPAND